MFTSWTQCPCSLNFQFQNIVKVNSLLPLKVETCCQQEEGREESFMRILFTHDWRKTVADIAGGDCCEDEIRIILQLRISQHSGAIICQHKQIFKHQNKSENNWHWAFQILKFWCHWLLSTFISFINTLQAIRKEKKYVHTCIVFHPRIVWT